MDDEIEIDASLEKVWETFTDLTCWADWSSILTDVTPRGGACIDEGGSFTCCINPYGVRVFFEARIEEVEPMKRIVWTGAKHLVRARHEFFFRRRNGKVIVASREVLRGLPLAFGGLFFPVGKFRRLKRVFLEDLKNWAEGGTP
jgi:uncharacterized protein YndB with AHSA1/START domain